LSLKLLYSILLFMGLHVLVWFVSNAQFISESWRDKSFYIMLVCSIPASLCAYYGTRFGYEAFNESVWAVRLSGFGISYFVFPILTYILLGESMFTLKTMTCVALSFLILAIQIWM